MADNFPKMDPQMAQALKQQIRQQLQGLSLTKDQLEALEQVFQYMLMHPEDYKDVLAQAIQEGVLDAGDLPEEYDAALLGTILMVLNEMDIEEEQGEDGEEQMLAKGGLAQMAKKVQAQGRNGDSILAHINRQEAEMLRRMGGSGTINPKTGLREFGFFSSVGKVFKSAAKAVGNVVKGVVNVAKDTMSSPIGQIAVPLALSYFGVPGMVGNAVGLSGTTATLAGNAIIGGATAALTGGNPLTGALANAALGYGTSGGFGGVLQKLGISPELAKSLSPAAGGALSSIARRQNPITGGLTAYLGSEAFNKYGPQLSKMIGVEPASATMGNASGIYLNQGTAPGIQLDPTSIPITQNLPYYPQATDAGQGLSMPIDFNKVTAPGIQLSPTDLSAVNNSQGTSFPIDFNNTSGPGIQLSSADWNAAFNKNNQGGGGGFSDLLKYGALGSMVLGGVGQQPQMMQINQQQGSPDQRSQMDLLGGMDPTLKDNLERSGQLNLWMAQNWNDIQAGKYASPRRGYAMGGALNRLARGSGSGRDDTIPARLSDGEYVIDAETVALLGNGSTDNGAKKLDSMRQQVRMQKGKALAKGKFSPNAKSPLAYIGGL